MSFKLRQGDQKPVLHRCLPINKVVGDSIPVTGIILVALLAFIIGSSQWTNEGLHQRVVRVPG